MATRDPKVSKYIQGCAPFARPVLTHLRRTIHKGGPALDEAIKWGMPAFLHHGKIVCGIAGFKAHCALWFWKGRAIVGSKPKDGLGNFGRIKSVNDLPPAAKIRAYVKKAMHLIDQRRALTSGSSRSRLRRDRG